MDPRTLAALGRLEVISRWLVDGVLSGLHRSPRKGFSVEFAEHRAYQPGDDLRFMDWKVAARADKWPAAAGVGVLIVEHNFDMVVRMCDRILVLDRGTVLVEDTAAAVAADPAVQRVYLGMEEVA